MKTMHIKALSVEHEDKGHFRGDEEELHFSRFQAETPCVVITVKDLKRLQKAASCEVEIEMIGDRW